MAYTSAEPRDVNSADVLNQNSSQLSPYLDLLPK